MLLSPSVMTCPNWAENWADAIGVIREVMLTPAEEFNVDNSASRNVNLGLDDVAGSCGRKYPFGVFPVPIAVTAAEFIVFPLVVVK